MEYQVFETTADYGVRAEGHTFCELVNNMLKGLYDIALEGEQAAEYSGEASLDLSEETEPEILHFLLSEALYYLYHKGAVVRLLSIEGKTATIATAENTAFVETEIKAVTRHRLSVEHVDNGLRGECVVDV